NPNRFIIKKKVSFVFLIEWSDFQYDFMVPFDDSVLYIKLGTAIQNESYDKTQPLSNNIKSQSLFNAVSSKSPKTRHSTKSTQTENKKISPSKRKATIKDIYHSWSNPVYKNQKAECEDKIPMHKLRYFQKKFITDTKLKKNVSDSILLARSTVVGQLDKKFIICKFHSDSSKEDSNFKNVELVAIDQHAADERVALEELFFLYYCCIVKIAYFQKRLSNSKEAQSLKSDDLSLYLNQMLTQTAKDNAIQGIKALSSPIKLRFDSRSTETILSNISILMSWGFFLNLDDYSSELEQDILASRNYSDSITLKMEGGIHLSSPEIDDNTLDCKYEGVFLLTHVPLPFFGRLNKDLKQSKSILLQILPSVCLWLDSQVRITPENNEFLPFVYSKSSKDSDNNDNKWIDMLKYCPPQLAFSFSAA
ncbi:hypothetical protein BB560_005683, partial [Smittium megazygosporum]